MGSTLFFLQAQSADGGTIAFVVLLAVLAGGGLALVLWSRRRGRSAPPPEPLELAVEEPEVEEGKAEPAAEESPEAVPEPIPEIGRAAVPETLLPAGRSYRDGLEKTRKQGFIGRIAGLFRKELDADLEQQIEEVLLTSDIGIKTAQKLMAALREKLDRQSLRRADAVWELLRREVEGMVGGGGGAREPAWPAEGPLVIAVVGVNGTGKTTTVGKLAARLTGEGKRVMVVAADTFRAAAVEQLAIWADRAHAGFYRSDEGKDPAAVAFEGIRKALEEQTQVVIIDTAGRLHTQKNLVEELKKVMRVSAKALPGAPHETFLVLDATTGQNAIQQAAIFGEAVGLTGIVLTKLDGTAKGGVVIGICDQMAIPVRYVGLGEKVEDLRSFDAPAFLDGLFERGDENG